MTYADAPIVGASEDIWATELLALLEDIHEQQGAIVPWKTGDWHSVQSIAPGITHAATTAVTANSIYASPIWVPRSISIDRVGLAVQAGAGTVARLMAHRSLANGLPGTLIEDFGTVDPSTSGDKTLTVDSTLPPGLVWLSMVSDGTPTIYGFTCSNFNMLGGTSQAGNQNYSPYRANGSTTAPDPWGTTSISYLSAQFLRIAVRVA